MTRRQYQPKERESKPKDPVRVEAGRKTAQALRERYGEEYFSSIGRAGGKVSYMNLVRQILTEKRREDGTINYEWAAERLSCIRFNRGFRYIRGLTSVYMERKAVELGLA